MLTSMDMPDSSRGDGSPPFRCDVRAHRERVTVVPVGELDMATVGELERVARELLDAGLRQLVVDLGELRFIDSSGLHLLLSIAAESRRDGFGLAVLPGSPDVQRVFAIAGVNDLVPFEPGGVH